MNSIEELIRKKLDAALTEEKKRVAASLFELTTAQPDKNDANHPTDGAQKQKQQENKRQQIAAQQARITELQGKASKSKDPDAMRQQLDIQKSKLETMKKELLAIG